MSEHAECACGRWAWSEFTRHPFTQYAETVVGWHESMSLVEVDVLQHFCDRCGTRLNADGSTTRMVPAAPSAAVRETLLYRALVDSDLRLEVIRGQLLGLDLLTYETTGWTPTDQGRTILAALEGSSGAVAQPQPELTDAELWEALRGYSIRDLARAILAQRGGGNDDHS